MLPPQDNRFASHASIPMPVRHRNSQATIYTENPYTAQMSNARVTVTAPTTSIRTDAHMYNGHKVTHTESRETLTPMVSPLHQSTPSVVKEERLPATVSTRAYEVFRRDPATLFPGAKIVSVGKPGLVTTPSGCILDLENNTIRSVYSGETTPIQPAHHMSTQYVSGAQTNCTTTRVGQILNSSAHDGYNSQGYATRSSNIPMYMKTPTYAEYKAKATAQTSLFASDIHNRPMCYNTTAVGYSTGKNPGNLTVGSQINTPTKSFVSKPCTIGDQIVTPASEYSSSGSAVQLN